MKDYTIQYTTTKQGKEIDKGRTTLSASSEVAACNKVKRAMKAKYCPCERVNVYCVII